MDRRDVGSSIGGYEIIERVGTGGMGRVYRARHARLERIVALKLIRPEIASQESFRVRFDREARLAASIEHPNVVPVYEAGEDHGTLFIAMRWVAGPDLRRMLASGPPGPAVTLAIVDQLADALDAAHENGLVHRDVKPANVLTEGSRMYLTDFGLAQSVVLAAGDHTMPGGFAGTLDYAAPELLDGHEGDARADNYSLACIAFEALTGSTPFPGEGLIAKLRAHHDRPTPAPSTLNPELPGAVDAVFARAMAVGPAARPATASEFAKELRLALAADGSPSGEPIRAGARHRARRPAALLGAVVAVGLAAAAAGLALTGAFAGGDRAAVAGSSARGAAAASDSAACGAQGRVSWTHQPVQECPLTAPLAGRRIPVYARPAANRPQATAPQPIGALHGTRHQEFVCQQRFTAAEYIHPRGWRNRWWAYTLSDDDHWGWVPEVFFSGGADDQPDGALRACPATLPGAPGTDAGGS